MQIRPTYGRASCSLSWRYPSQTHRTYILSDSTNRTSIWCAHPAHLLSAAISRIPSTRRPMINGSRDIIEVEHVGRLPALIGMHAGHRRTRGQSPSAGAERLVFIALYQISSDRTKSGIRASRYHRCLAQLHHLRVHDVALVQVPPSQDGSPLPALIVPCYPHHRPCTVRRWYGSGHVRVGM